MSLDTKCRPLPHAELRSTAMRFRREICSMSLVPPYDFRAGRALGAAFKEDRGVCWFFRSALNPAKRDLPVDFPGYENALIYDKSETGEKSGVSNVVRTTLSSDVSGIQLDIRSDQPAVQVYLASLNLPRKEVHGGPDKKYGERSTVAIEQEGWIDALRSLWVLQPTALGQLGDDRISDQLSHQFDLRSVRWNNAGVESLACVGTNGNTVCCRVAVSGFREPPEDAAMNREQNQLLSVNTMVFHAFAHRWACQLIYHPLKCHGFGFMNRERCEHFWHSISKLIPYLQVAGIEPAEKASLRRLGSWLVRQTVHCEGKQREAKRDLAECGIEEDVLREEWKKQVAAQTKPAQIEEVILACKHVNALFQSMTVLRDALGDPDLTAHVLLNAESRVENAEAAWKREQQKLQRLEQQLGVTNATLIQKLRHSDYYAARMNTKMLHKCKFKLDLIEWLFRHLRSGVEPTERPRWCSDQALGANYQQHGQGVQQTMCQHRIADPEQEGPCRRSGTESHSCQRYFQLDIDDAIWQDMGLDEDTAPAAWLVNDKVHAGILCNAAEGPLRRRSPVTEGITQTPADLVRHRVGGSIRDNEDCSRCRHSAGSTTIEDSDEEGNSDDDEGVLRRGEGGGGDKLLYVLEAVEHKGRDVEEAQTTVQQMKVDNGGWGYKAQPSMVLTDFFQRAAVVAGVCAGEAKIKNEHPATSTAPSSPAVLTPGLESRMCGLLAKRNAIWQT
ncbi:hypothetical protein B0H14DRAFT_2601168 [Mycena olivaceomarginata]|nr:hypothetical protein B0H14DRAFT_2601168 [Mycena olivaceomarginata]